MGSGSSDCRAAKSVDLEVSNFITLVNSDLGTKDKFGKLISWLAEGRDDINATGENDMTALHFTILNGDELLTKVLIAFGADINAQNEFEQTPLDIAIQNNQEQLIPLLVSVGCKRAGMETASVPPPPSPPPLPQPGTATLVSGCDGAEGGCVAACCEGGTRTPGRWRSGACNVECADTGTPMGSRVLTYELQQHMERRFEMSRSVVGDEAVAMALQQQEISKYRLRNQDQCGDVTPDFETFVEEGCRILSLDGGGIRGLIQIEILIELERLTGKRIVELFDCIIGTSTGGILALGLVYGRKTLLELRQLYFKLRERIFAESRGGFACNSIALEELLKEELGIKLTMNDIQHPKVLVSAVDKRAIPLKLQFFNNCFNDEYSTQLVWKVARYTSAAPMYFTECDNYIDGGVLSNNPCDSGLTRLQDYYYQQSHTRLPIACVVSVGSGVCPTETLGSVDVHEHLNIGKLLNLGDAVRKTQNLVKLLSAAIGESEAVADKCKTMCTEQKIPFYRFSPLLNEKIEPGEIDSVKLLNMMISAVICAHQDTQMGRLVSLLHKLLWME